MRPTAFLAAILTARTLAAFQSCSNGVTVINGSISCQGQQCTVICGGKASNVAAPASASCPGSTTATCNGQKVQIANAASEKRHQNHGNANDVTNNNGQNNGGTGNGFGNVGTGNGNNNGNSGAGASGRGNGNGNGRGNGNGNGNAGNGRGNGNGNGNIGNGNGNGFGNGN